MTSNLREGASRLMLITDRRSVPPGRTLESVVAEYDAAGGDLVQLRERDLDGGALFDLAARIRNLLPNPQCLVINDRIDVAAALGVGVHLRVGSPPVPRVRLVLTPGALVGRSTHSLDEARKAEAEGADYVLLGPVFDTPSKRGMGTPIGVETVAKVTRKVAIPVIAVGGITVERVPLLRPCGAAGVAMIRGFMGSDDLKKTIAYLRRGMAS